jgi:hypothetical protein
MPHHPLQVSRIVDSMPRIMHASRARKLGLPQDTAIEEIIEGCVRLPACVRVGLGCGGRAESIDDCH